VRPVADQIAAGQIACRTGRRLIFPATVEVPVDTHAVVLRRGGIHAEAAAGLMPGIASARAGCQHLICHVEVLGIHSDIDS
jgi:hypothetical protein